MFRLLPLIVLFTFNDVDAFAPSHHFSSSSPHAPSLLDGRGISRRSNQIISPTTSRKHSIGRQTVKCSMMLPSFVKSGLNISPTTRNSLLLCAAIAAVYRNRQKILFPGTAPDSKFSEPLPEGKYGCPFFGSNVLEGTSEFGPGWFYKKASESVKNPSIFKSFFFGKPLVAISGFSNRKEVLGSEFRDEDHGVQQSVGPKGLQTLLGTESLILEHNSDEHNFQRRLVGASMSAEGVISASLPVIQQTAKEQMDQMLLSKNTPINMEDICTNFTLDIAWRQILGLDLQETEVENFRTAVDDWISGLSSLRAFLPGVKFTRFYKAKQHLVSKIEGKIQSLKKNGPDGSTTSSAMVFARDEDSNDKLTTMQIVDNALLLIIAGSETSASTLTNVVLFLGRYPEVHRKVLEEQKALVAKYGATLTKAHLDNECPYLEAVIKETMRIKTVVGGIDRVTKETMVVGGKQIPKGWNVNANIYLTHREDPRTKTEDGSHMELEGFKPDRWLNDETRPTSNFIPFGWGPRYCLGARLAMAEMKVFISEFVRNADFRLVNDAEGPLEWKKQTIIPKPVDGVMITPIPLAE